MTPLHPGRNSSATLLVRVSHDAYQGRAMLQFLALREWGERLLDFLRTVKLPPRSVLYRTLAVLLCLQGVAAAGLCAWSPHYARYAPQVRLMMVVTVGCLAFAVAVVPVILVLLQPDRRSTRVALGVCQSMMLPLLFRMSGQPVNSRGGLVTATLLIAVTLDWIAKVTIAPEPRAECPPVWMAMDESTTASLRRQRISHKLERVICSNGLKLVYQPIFKENEQMIAVEVLARWHDAELGTVSPAEFIPIAEATNLIVPLSNWVLREACKQMKQWIAIDTSLKRLAVNVSVRHVGQLTFVATIAGILRETGLPAHHLELEVTEGALASDFDLVKRNLAQLRALGVRIAIDDFGTGYSSLSRVRELDVDTLKVDRQFLLSASDTGSGAAVVQAIIEMAHCMDLSVIAEGVETLEQMEMLRAMRCDEMQGFLLACPQEPTIITDALHMVAESRVPRRATPAAKAS